MAVEEKTGTETSNLVVIGASAGGLESLSVLVSTLPANFPAPIVVALHLSPSRVSALGDILNRRGPLHVMTIQDHAHLQPGTIYVVPSNRHVRIADQQAILVQDSDGPQPSIDLLFRTAAEAYGENLIAVVLSGTGSDGALGARAVKSEGGTVIIQNPDTAAFPGMPSSLSPSDVDVMADRDRIGGLLTEFVNGGYDVPPLSEHSLLRSFLEEIREETGVDFTTYRQATIQRRIQRRMAAVGVSTFPEYVRLVRSKPDERRRMTQSFLINVTRFFRDPQLFKYLREHVLPELIRNAVSHGEGLRFWSAGCSTGEEAYSLAIMILELLEEQKRTLDVRIFATDLDDEAVSFARKGVYAAGALAELPPEMVERYFSPIGDEFEVRKNLRGMLVFGEHDLAHRAPFPRVDLILCRNVLIYFTTALQRRALQLFAFSLRQNGYLVLGKSESVSPLEENFTVDQPRLKVYRRTGDRLFMPPSSMRDVLPLSIGGKREPATAAPQQEDAPENAHHFRDSSWDGEQVLYSLPYGLVIVNDRYDIRYINAEARRLFGIHATALDRDLIHLAERMDPVQLRRLIDEALRSRTMVRGVLAINSNSGEAVQSIEVVCATLNTGEDERRPSVTIHAVDVTEREDIRRRLAAADETANRLVKANEEVLSENRHLSQTIVRLRDENDQMQVASTEIQAATEEVETLNEELQASNEELETLNEELQSTIEELNTTNDDLEARSLELQTLAINGETSRRQLRAILDAVDDGVVVVDAGGSIVLQNELFTSLIGEGVSTAEMLDDNGEPLSDQKSPILRAARGETFAMTFRAKSGSDEVDRFEAMGRPVSMVGGPRMGVLTIRLCPEDGQTS
jgi:two-component system CheB/CheR fusion protein